MRILLTGSTGYIGRRLLPALIDAGHHVICMVRDKRRFDEQNFNGEAMQRITVIEADLQEPNSLETMPLDIDAAYYLVHSMNSAKEDFSELERKSTENFVAYIDRTRCEQIIYVGGIVNDDNLSKHLQSRNDVDKILRTAKAPVTTLRAAIIIGSGSASFEIIRDLVEKLPVMVAPKWLKSRCQPIGIRNVIEYLKGVLMTRETFGQSFDIGGPDILTYKEMLMGYARVRGLKRWIIPVPVLTPKLSSLWLYFVTSTAYPLARNLVDSLKNEVICHDQRIQDIVRIKLLSYTETLQIAFERIQQRNVISSWTDTIGFTKNFMHNVEVPVEGCLKDERTISFTRPVDEVVENLWRIGGNHGWYFGNWLWKMRGFADKAFGGVGLRRGRRSQTDLKTGDALDFWRVLLADKRNGRLLLYAEMKLPGEAWLEFTVASKDGKNLLTQTATFRPLGLWGRLYWYSVWPFHGLIFPQMARRITQHMLAD